MGIRTDRDSRQQLIFYSMVLMLIALFTSRALLSIGMILFLVLTCVHSSWKEQFKNFLHSPLLFGMALLFLIPVLTWGWSDNKEEWFRWARIKLPLFLFPFAFAGSWQLHSVQWRNLALSFVTLVFAGCCWSLVQYFNNYDSIQESYLRAKLIATPLENDHVRFSLLVCIAVISTTWLFTKMQSRIAKAACVFGILFFIVFLHILSARTGLAGLYIFMLAGVVYLLFKIKNVRWSIIATVVLIAMPLLAWYTLPTFQNRIRYFNYDFSFIKTNQYLPGANDGNRMLSLRAGWDLVKENPFGVGSGDVVDETYAWYDHNVPGMLATDKLYPSSEWLCYGAAAGWVGLLLFTCIMLLPFFEKNVTDRFFWICINIVAAFSLLFDIGLETQFGVFIYAFIVLWWYKKV